MGVDFVFFLHRVLLGGLGEGYDDVKLGESVRVLWSFEFVRRNGFLFDSYFIRFGVMWLFHIS